jgi:hypothetical protein
VSESVSVSVSVCVCLCPCVCLCLCLCTGAARLQFWENMGVSWHLPVAKLDKQLARLMACFMAGACV